MPGKPAKPQYRPPSKGRSIGDIYRSVRMKKK